MRFQTPQFIEVEDKIFGPLTLKQFVYLVGGAGLSFILYQLLPLFAALPFIAGAVTLSIALAFYKVNNKPFINFLEAAFNYIKSTRLYIWRKTINPMKPVEEEILPTSYLPKISESKLKDISWSLGVKDSIYSEQAPESQEKK